MRPANAVNGGGAGGANGGRLRLETDFFRKSNNDSVTRDRRIRLVQIRGFHLLGILLIVLAASVLAKQAADFVLNWERLRVRHFQLVRPPQLAGPRLMSILDRFRGNILAVDLRRLEAQLLELPEVKSAAVSRLLPATLRVDFVLRRPRLQRPGADGWQVLDETGRLIRLAAAPDPGLLTVEGTSDEDLAKVIDLLPELQRIERPLAWIAWRLPHGLEVGLRDAPEVFYPGEAGVAERIRRYFRIQPRLAALAGPPAYVDLRWENRIYLGVKPNQEARHEE